MVGLLDTLSSTDDKAISMWVDKPPGSRGPATGGGEIGMGVSGGGICAAN